MQTNYRRLKQRWLRLIAGKTGKRSIGEQLHSYVFCLGSLAVLSITGLGIGLFLLVMGEFKTRLVEASQQSSSLVQDFLSAHERDLLVVSDFVRQAPEEEIEQILKLSRNSTITGLYIIEKDRSISHQSYSPHHQLKNLAQDQPWAEHNRTNLTWFDYRKQAGKPVPDLLMAVPVNNSEGQYQRTLLAHIDLFPLWQQVNRFRIGKNGMVFLLDAGGTVILHRSTHYLKEDMSVRQLLGLTPQQLNNNEFHIKKDSALGYSLVTSHTIEGMPWRVVALLPLSGYLAAASILLFVLVLFVCLTLLLARRAEKFTREEIVRPLQVLYSATKKFKSGDLQHRIPDTGQKEFHALGSAFNTMGEQLHKNMEAINRHVKRLKLTSGVYDHAVEGILIISADGRVIEVNPAFTAITGFTREDVLGKSLRQLRPRDQGMSYCRGLLRGLADKGVWIGDLQTRKPCGDRLSVSLTLSSIYDEQGRVQNYLGLLSDISERMDYEENLEQIAHYDTLTELPNRLMITGLLGERLQQKQPLALAYIDLDSFKEINDRHGHETGDKLLQAVAKRLTSCLRDCDTIGRLGGDEFVAVITDLTPGCEPPMIKRLLEAAATSIFIDGHKLKVSASLGLSFYSGETTIDGDTLMRQADQAMYRAKMAGRNQYHVFDSLEHDQMQNRHQDLDRLRSALEADEFILFFQPKVNMRSGELLGAEALIRWQCPEKGLVPPGKFIPLIENNDLEIEVSRWVIHKALEQLHHWHQQGLDTSVSINLGGHYLLESSFIVDLTRALGKYPELPPGLLEIEILESSALEDIQAISRTIKACRTLGVLFSLDDFGTGYSSISYLKSLPVSQLKIDRSFIHDMMQDANNRALVKSIIDMALSFDRRVIAEGVETDEQGQLLIEMGCESGQGFGIGKPMPADAFMEWQRKWKPAHCWSQNSFFSR